MYSSQPAVTSKHTQPGLNELNELKAALLTKPSYGPAIARLIIAATLNHIRRVFTPWLGQYIWYSSPLNDLRIARTNPEVFIDAMLGGASSSWGWVLCSWGQKVLWDFAGAYLRGRMFLSKGKKAGRISKKGGRNKDKAYEEMWMDLIKVGYLVWVLAAVEYGFARGMNTVAWCTALYKLLAGGEAEYRALGIVLKVKWKKVPLTVWLLSRYLKHGLWPLMWESVRSAVLGHPGLLMAVVSVVGGVTGLMKYRSTLYIALEISGMFVFAGYILAGLLLMGIERVHHPMEFGLGHREDGRVLSQRVRSRIDNLGTKSPIPARGPLPRRRKAG
ncbi:hypothetical protein C8A03DRAFT_17712 [Achaetomium macrosporum]|uniref:Uncharacterized protein n=1 Tax=Achaetomium macrosporum TaxID=79813 RepID=A0AAN7H9K0_9PEZI|nr:hypothetical protein C8A03DRAFT_17712 [Achaetomium macrosporum]